jgi:hypothetical protein
LSPVAAHLSSGPSGGSLLYFGAPRALILIGRRCADKS